MYGYTGKILRVNLTTREHSIIRTENYKQWIGGHGIATAIWFDLVKDKTISAFDPRNTLVIMAGLFAGTLVPAANRTEMVGIQSQSYPKEWFTRSNIGARVGAMMKYAGYDGIVIEGASDTPVWINVVAGQVEFRDAQFIWGLDTYETCQDITSEVAGANALDNWIEKKGHDMRSTQRPSVLCIGPAGENMSRLATVQSDAGSAFGQGGFGGVWGSKKLKAISFLGAGSVPIADAKGLMDARLWAERNYAADLDNPRVNPWQEFITSHFGGHPNRDWAPYAKGRRPSGCVGCHLCCKPKTASGNGNESICVEGLMYQNWELAAHGKVTEVSGMAANLSQRMGLNAFEFYVQFGYLKALYDQGILGPGKAIDTTLLVGKIGEAEFVRDLFNKIAHRIEIGDDLAEGFPRAAERWGRINEDLETGILGAMFYGYPVHYDARTEVYWGYASIFGGRDINCHDFNVPAYWMPTLDIENQRTPIVSAEQVATWVGEMPPYFDPEMMNFDTSNLYSISMARTSAWVLHYSTFWKQSCGLCDNAFADFVNPYGPNNRGLTPEGELKFYRAVTGEDITFEQSMEMGRKMYNLDKGIWTLQGRTRDDEVFPEYVYKVDAKGTSYAPGRDPSYWMPTKQNGVWDYRNVVPRHLDRSKVEDLKTLYYELQGWDTATGWQTKAGLQELGLDGLATELGAAGKLA